MSREPLSCAQAQEALARIKSLKTEFDHALDEAIRTGELERARALRRDLEFRLHSIREGLTSPLERRLDLKRHYEAQRQVLETAGVLERLPSGELGIYGIDGKEYPLPAYHEVRELVRDRKDVLEQKADQGFTKLLIVPFGMKLDDLTERYKQRLVKHKAEGKLFAAKEHDSDPDEPLELDATTPVYVWDGYQDADTTGKLVYDPKEFNQNHGGKTKAELLAAGQAHSTSSGQAWRIILIETNANIPRETKGISLAGRKQFEANKTPQEYLETIGKDHYHNESGTTPEDWLMQAITILEEKNQVLDDYQGKGSIAYNTGAYFPASDHVPCACWNRDDKRANLGRDAPTDRSSDFGARCAVRV